MLPVSSRKNVQYKRGRRIRLPDVPGLDFERRWWADGAVVAGIDEVGRGAWAGPVTYAAVVLPAERRMYKLRDSKVLDPERRGQLSARIWEFALAAAIGHASNAEIDEVGMTEAIRRAARRAVDGLGLRPDVCLIDGNWDFLAGYGTTNERIVYGDARSASIAAASIVAKVNRDGLMSDYCPQYPAYGFSSNKGYPSPPHMRVLREIGPCELHRQTWTPIRAAMGLPPFVREVVGAAGARQDALWDAAAQEGDEDAIAAVGPAKD